MADNIDSISYIFYKQKCVMSNSKNTLQEFCQKNKLPLPTYDTSTKGQNIFRSSVTITYNGKEYTSQGFIEAKKKTAEISAATAMLTMLGKVRKEEIKYYNSPRDIYILVDLENIHLGNFFEQKQFNDEFHFIGFATENHPSISSVPVEVKIITIRSDRKDAADILMIGYTATLIGTSKEDIIIVTKDHFGPGLVDYINTINDKVNATVIKTTTELEMHLDRFVL